MRRNGLIEREYLHDLMETPAAGVKTPAVEVVSQGQRNPFRLMYLYGKGYLNARK